MEVNNKPNWKQWIPVYGLYQMAIDCGSGKPIMASLFYAINHPFKYMASAVSHIATPFCAIKGIEKLLQ